MTRLASQITGGCFFTVERMDLVDDYLGPRGVWSVLSVHGHALDAEREAEAARASIPANSRIEVYMRRPLE